MWGRGSDNAIATTGRADRDPSPDLSGAWAPTQEKPLASLIAAVGKNAITGNRCMGLHWPSHDRPGISQLALDLSQRGGLESRCHRAQLAHGERDAVLAEQRRMIAGVGGLRAEICLTLC